MNTLIAYATKHGCTEKCAMALSKKLSGKVDLCNLKSGNIPELIQYDKVIIGGSIYIGKICKEASDFCTKNLNTLKNKKLGLFICGMRDGNDADTQLNTSFPQVLLDCATASECFGGEFAFGKMNFFERFIVKKISKVDKDVSSISDEKINKFAGLMQA